MTRLHHALVAFAVAGCAGAETPPAAVPVDRVAKVAGGLLAPVRIDGTESPTFSVADRLAKYQIPGVTIAVADSGRIVWARGFGVKTAGTADSVGEETLFQAASITKPVSATAALVLAEQGKLALDRNVNEFLTSWKLPENDFTVKEKVTFRRIMSHSGGLSVHGFDGYKVGDPLPTVPQILDGAKPANSGPVRVEAVPGTSWRYSGGGGVLMQLAMTDVTGEPYDALLKRLVLAPAGMTRSLYSAGLPDSLAPRAASAHRADGTMIPGRWHVYPELGPASLWTTPTDLLHWAIAITDARAGRSKAILSDTMAARMLTMEMAPTGLGPFLEGSGRGFRFGHGGDNEGFHADLVYFPETGQGAAIMTNGDRGQALITEIKLAIAAEYDWPDVAQRVVKVVAVDSAAMARLTGSYVIDYDGQKLPISFTVEEGKLVARSPLVGDALLPESPTSFVGSGRGFSYRFTLPGQGPASAVVIGLDASFALTATRPQ